MRRQLAWRTACAEMARDRAVRPDIREEPLIGYLGDLGAWRGRSGKRYLVRRQPLDLEAFDRAQEGLALAVARDEDGRARLVAIAGTRPTLSWFAKAKIDGATELHLHTLAEGEDERGAIVMDLLP